MPRLLFASHVGSARGGAPNSLLKLLRYLQDEYQVAVVVPNRGELSNTLQQMGMTCHLLRPRIRKLPILIHLIKSNGYDLVYANNFHYRSLVMLWAAKLAGRPFVWHIRETFGDVPRLYVDGFRRADAIVAISEASARSVGRHISGKKVEVIYNGVDLEDFAISRAEAQRHVHTALGTDLKDDKIIVNVGSVCERKGQLLALDVAARVVQAFPTAHYCFIGGLTDDPKYSAQVKARIAELQLEKNIHLVDFQKNVPVWLRGADIMCHTAIREPLGRVVLESMAARLPAVVYNVPGVNETVVSGETGYLVPFNDVSSMAQAIEQLLVNSSLREQMGERGYQRVTKHFSAKETARRVAQVIGQVLNE